MIGKVIGSAISLILVVGVVVGVVVSVHNKDGSGSTDSLSPQMKAVTQFCQPTNYKEACTETLSKANTTDPKQLIQAGVLAISDALSKALNSTDDFVVKAQSEPRGKMALDDCKDLLQQAQQELQATMTKIVDSDIRSLADRSDDFRTWLSSIIAYQEMCVDGFEDNSQVKLAMINSTSTGNQLTDNVLTILGGLSDVLKSLGLSLNLNPGSRRLLEEDGYPSWMSAADRKLLASRSVAGVAPNAVVAQDGSGQFRTVQAAVNACPKNHNGRWVIYVKAGVYREQVHITKAQPRIYMYGDGPRKSIITGNKSYSKGIGTWMTATVIVESDGFIAKSIGFSNTAGPDGHQALALRVNSDMSSFYNVRLDGYQDTLCYQSQRQFYRNCVLSGTVDFLFGYGAAVIQNSLIILRKPNPNQFNTVTADGRKEKGMPTGLVIHNCRIVPEQKLVPQKFQIKSYLGRPWKDYSTTIIMESTLGDVIQPEGWTPWSGNLFLNTLYYAEFGNAGPGANTARRVKWSRQITKNEATRFTVANFIQGNQWIASTGTPALLGFKRH